VLSECVTLNFGNSEGDNDGANLAPVAACVARWLVQSRICRRASVDRFENRKPPVFCFSSIQASWLSTSIRRLFSENQKRIVSLLGTGAAEWKQSPPAETFNTIAPLFESRLI